MTSRAKPRLRYFEEASGQRHIVGDDRYLYRREKPRYRINVIGTGTIGQEHMRVASMLGIAAVNGIYDRGVCASERRAADPLRQSRGRLQR